MTVLIIYQIPISFHHPNPTVVLIPGLGMVAWGKDKSESRVTAEFYNCAVEVMRGAEAIDQYIALPQQEAFDIEYWLLEEAKLKRMPAEKELARQVAIVIGAVQTAINMMSSDDAGAPSERPAALRTARATSPQRASVFVSIPSCTTDIRERKKSGKVLACHSVGAMPASANWKCSKLLAFLTSIRHESPSTSSGNS